MIYGQQAASSWSAEEWPPARLFHTLNYLKSCIFIPRPIVKLTYGHVDHVANAPEDLHD
jgi:hypothetical protein